MSRLTHIVQRKTISIFISIVKSYIISNKVIRRLKQFLHTHATTLILLLKLLHYYILIYLKKTELAVKEFKNNFGATYGRNKSIRMNLNQSEKQFSIEINPNRIFNQNQSKSF